MIYHIIRFLVPGFRKSVVGLVCDIPHKVPGTWFQ